MNGSVCCGSFCYRCFDEIRSEKWVVCVVCEKKVMHAQCSDICDSCITKMLTYYVKNERSRPNRFLLKLLAYVGKYQEKHW